MKQKKSESNLVGSSSANKFDRSIYYVPLLSFLSGVGQTNKRLNLSRTIKLRIQISSMSGVFVLVW